MPDLMPAIRRVHTAEDASRADPTEEQHREHDLVEGRNAEAVALLEAGSTETGDEFADGGVCLAVRDGAGGVFEVMVDWFVGVVLAVVEGEGDGIFGREFDVFFC